MAFLPAGNDGDEYRDGSLKKLIETNGFECVEEDFPDMQHGAHGHGPAHPCTRPLSLN